MSDGGGFCDCGDKDAWRRDASCRLHSTTSDEANAVM